MTFANDELVVLDYSHVRRVSEIHALEAVSGTGCQTAVHLGAETLIIRRPLKDCQAKLNERAFFLANRSCLVNLANVKEMRRDGEKLAFVLTNGQEIPISRRQGRELKKMTI